MSVATDLGRFVWYELMSSDPAGSIAFYENLLGWRFRDTPVGGRSYTMAHLGETAFGGVETLRQQGVPTHWLAYVSVADTDAACQKVQQLGGKVLVAPTDMEPGRFAVIADPSGAVLALFAAKRPLPPEPERQPVGAFCWSECLTRRADKIADFYAQLFGWTLTKQQMEVAGQKSAYWIFNRGERMTAGCMDLPPQAEAAGAPPHWLHYIHVQDVDRTAQKAEALRGSVACPPMDITGIGRFCIVNDPQGGMVALFKGAASAS
jgi:predicted enzyme related to lactoylglutathione lyase